MNDISKVSPYRIDGFFETKTNCITKIPQDIKLELSEDGVLTLKAGSKVYIPNGFEEDSITKKFDNLIINTDISWGKLPELGNNSPIFIYINENNQDSHYRLISSCFSGNSDSEAGTTYYNTTTNIITAHNSTGDIHCSFPIGIIEKNNEGNLQINQVFNGFGYMGSTIFALPGIEGLIPQGRNTNNEIINKSFITNKVLITTNGGSTDTRNIILSDTICDHPELSGYDDINNIIWRDNFEHTDYYHIDCMVCCQVSYTNGRVTSFNPKTVFQAVDLSNIDYVIETYFNNGNWYRKYKSGWIEQGGTFNGTADSEFTVPFNIPFVNIPYVNTSSFGAKSNAQLFFKNQGYNATTTNFKFTGWCPIIWYACGF